MATRRHANARRSHQPGTVRPMPWLLGGAVVLVVLVGAMVWLTRQGQSASSATSLDQPAPGLALALPSTAGSPVTLSSLHGKRIVLFFYEGSTCGACQQQLVELQGDLATIRGLGAQVYGVSVDPLPTSAALASQLHLGFPILQDVDHQLGSALGDFRVASGMDMGPVDNHAIFVLDGRGHLRWKQLAASTMHVPDQDVITALRGI